ncbi:hypothetical protein F5Y16DRAFT_389086 [Xylariaceae sp. FL0255]|nr:hypothetical protein F5Y16DRAFT_389086 [Xylariaceae sp. FL0255]
MGIGSGIGHLIQSVGELIQGIFMGIIHAVQFVINSILAFFGAAIDAVVGLFRGFVNFVEGTLGFAFHNFFILGTLAAAVFAYLLYAQRQGTTPVSRAVKNK